MNSEDFKDVTSYALLFVRALEKARIDYSEQSYSMFIKDVEMLYTYMNVANRAKLDMKFLIWKSPENHKKETMWYKVEKAKAQLDEIVTIMESVIFKGLPEDVIDLGKAEEVKTIPENEGVPDD